MSTVAARLRLRRASSTRHVYYLFIYFLALSNIHPIQITSSNPPFPPPPRTTSHPSRALRHLNPRYTRSRARNGTQLATGLKITIQGGLGMASAVQAAPLSNGVNGISTNGLHDDALSTKAGKVKSKNQLRRQKAKAKKAAPAVQVRVGPLPLEFNQQLTCTLLHHTVHPCLHVSVVAVLKTNGDAPEEKDETVKEEPDTRNDNVEYVSEQLDVGPALEAFSDVFARFQFSLDSNTVRLVFPISSTLSSFLSHLTRHLSVSVSIGQIGRPAQQRRSDLLRRRHGLRDRLSSFRRRNRQKAALQKETTQDEPAHRRRTQTARQKARSRRMDGRLRRRPAPAPPPQIVPQHRPDPGPLEREAGLSAGQEGYREAAVSAAGVYRGYGDCDAEGRGEGEGGEYESEAEDEGEGAAEDGKDRY